MKVAILGTGSWGTALAQVLCDNGHNVIMYGIDRNQINDINLNHKNTAFFSDNVTLPLELRATDDIGIAAQDMDAFVCAVPSKFIADAVPKIAPYVEDMAKNIAKVLGVERGVVNVKATTEEHLGFTGRGEGISAHAVTLIAV